MMQFPFRLSASALAAAASITAMAPAGPACAQAAPATPATPATPAAPAVQGPTAVTGNASTVMFCVEGPGTQCSGTDAIRTDNGVTLTSSGVQVYGKSTSDLAPNNPNPGTATGMMLASGGTAEMRISKDASFQASNPALILRNLGISWDIRSERPTIIETFQATQGRTVFAANGTLESVPLPLSTDLVFYDYASKGPAATQGNYANNRYFPRTNNPPRCGTDVPPAACPSVETTGVQVVIGDWRTGGTIPDDASAIRLHEDGDAHAGNGIPGPNGQVTLIPGASGVGVPFPGSKGFRSLSNLSYGFVNLAKWLTQDGVSIPEWGGTIEHNQNRRGLVAYGDVTAPATVPAAGTATYAGFAYGWAAPNASDEPVPFVAEAGIIVDFATRQVAVAVASTVTDDAARTPLVAVNFTSTVGLGANGSNVANYLNGPVTAGALTGGLGGRLFGPGSTAGPPEAGAAFSLTNSATGAVVVGGIIARRR